MRGREHHSQGKNLGNWTATYTFSPEYLVKIHPEPAFSRPFRTFCHNLILTLSILFRFYFVGDEDLLEIIGNSKNIARLQKHFKKMFAGVAAILLNEDNTVILGIASREGEEVQFIRPVSTVDHPKINEWLTLVEKEMRFSLASNLAQAVQDIKQFKEGSIDPQKYMEWCDKYQAQIVVLAAQILWSEDVEAALQQSSENPSTKPLNRVLSTVEATLNVLADSVLQEQPPLRRKKLEHLVR